MLYEVITVTRTDLVRQLWLDNDFYGNIFSFHFDNKKVQMTFGGSWNRYKGNHYGEVVQATEGRNNFV